MTQLCRQGKKAAKTGHTETGATVSQENLLTETGGKPDVVHRPRLPTPEFSDHIKPYLTALRCLDATLACHLGSP